MCRLAILLTTAVIAVSAAPVAAAVALTTQSAVPTAPESVLWTGDAEEDGPADWWWPAGDHGGGEYDSGSGWSAPSRDVAHSGARSTKMSLSNGVGGVRLFRWRELRANRTTRQSTWMYVPRAYTLTADPDTGRFLILFEFKSRTSDNRHNDPFWYVNAYSRKDGSTGARLTWGYQSRLEGPHAGERGWRNYGDVTIPIGRWFKIESTLRQSKDFDGALSVTVDGRRLASVTGVRTGWPSCTHNSWCVDTHWAVTNYSDGIAETPANIYVDDSRIALVSQCSDGIDNDGDGRSDHRADPGCLSQGDNDETDPQPAAGPPAVVAASSTTPSLLRPFPVVRLGGLILRNGIRVSQLTVQSPSGSRITIRCGRSSGSCPRAKTTRISKGRRIRFREFERKLRAGTVLRIYVTKPRRIGKYTRFTIVRRGAPRRVDRCARADLRLVTCP